MPCNPRHLCDLSSYEVICNQYLPQSILIRQRRRSRVSSLNRCERLSDTGPTRHTHTLLPLFGTLFYILIGFEHI